MIDNLILSNMVENNEIVNSLHKNGEKIKTIEELNTWDKEADDIVILHTD